MAPPLAVALLLAPCAATAQEAGPTDRFGGISAQQIEVTAGTGDDSASIGLQLSGERKLRDGKANTVTAYFEQFSMIVSTPFDGKNDAAPTTLDGLANGTKLTLRWGQFGGSARLDIAADAERIFEEAQAICRGKAGDHFIRSSADLGPNPDPEQRTAVEKARDDEIKECNNPENGSESLIVTHLSGKLGAYHEAQLPGDSFDWGFETAVGYKKFDYVDPTTLAAHDARKAQFSAKGYYTRYLRGSSTAISASVGYERAYKAADEEILCPAGIGTTPVTCTSASPAAPTLDEGVLVALGLRHRFRRGDGTIAPIAIAPQVTWDALDNVVGVDVPLYFLSDGDSGLKGGVRVGWRSDTKKVSFGVFIGSGFNLLK
jgi:hypothetical protein